MKIHILYHQVKLGIDCPDGVVAAAIAHHYHKDFGPVTIEGACYRKDYPVLPDIEIPPATTKVVIVDFSYPASWLNHWQAQGLEIEVLEHHADKFPWLEGFSGAVLDDRECGATIAWRHYYPDRPLPKNLEHVRRRDIGLDGYYSGGSVDSEAFNLGFGEYRSGLKDLPIEEKLTNIAYVVFDAYWQFWSKAFKNEGRPQIVERDRLIADRLPLSTLTELEGIPCAFYDFTDDQAIARHYSLLGHKIAEYHGVELAWMVDGKSNHLRSTTPSVADKLNTTNCTAIAQKFGGGGHPCASGWQC